MYAKCQINKRDLSVLDDNATLTNPVLIYDFLVCKYLLHNFTATYHSEIRNRRNCAYFIVFSN